ncbi:HNH endonuclease [Pseudomonas sp.]|uniref:HNH endonuclease n=1 Tax=Pseudomonas sp. TaxID=306 RepID=UPI0019EBCF0E|nr:HNH endonuclease [Pseudomonas sp.]MBF0675576.1 HNH endonuclease [Pseudomonas sp.]
MTQLTYERLREALRYSPIVGVFEWRITGRKIRPGYLAGAVVTGGYVRIGLDRKHYAAHQLAWFYMTKSWPDRPIDHIDGDPSNNAFSNLRLATLSQNSANSRTNSANTSGVKGVTFDRQCGKWRAVIRAGGKAVFDKSFSSLEEARVAIEKAREEIHGEFANHGMHGYEKEELDIA